jgi:hypothetical protein
MPLSPWLPLLDLVSASTITPYSLSTSVTPTHHTDTSLSPTWSYSVPITPAHHPLLSIPSLLLVTPLLSIPHELCLIVSPAYSTSVDRILSRIPYHICSSNPFQNPIYELPQGHRRRRRRTTVNRRPRRRKRRRRRRSMEK